MARPPIRTGPAAAGRDDPRVETVLVIGSHPPLRSPAAEATVAAVRRELAAGNLVRTGSPRASAAQMVVPLSGLGSARLLERARRQTGARRLVLCVEPGIPLPSSWADAPTWLTLRAALRRFEEVTLLVSDTSPSVLKAVHRLASAVSAVRLSGAAAAAAAATDGPSTMAKLASRVTVEVVTVPSLGSPLPGATALGPPGPRLRWGPLLRAEASRRGRRLLGPLYKPLRLSLLPVEKLVAWGRRRL